MLSSKFSRKYPNNYLVTYLKLNRTVARAGWPIRVTHTMTRLTLYRTRIGCRISCVASASERRSKRGAQILSLDRKTLYRKLERWGVSE